MPIAFIDRRAQAEADILQPQSAPQPPANEMDNPRWRFVCPTQPEIARWISIGGGGGAWGTTKAIMQFRNDVVAAFQSFQTVAPGTAAAIVARIERANAELQGAIQDIYTAREKHNHLRDALIAAGTARRDLVTAERETEAAKAKLAEPSCVDMDAAELFKLSQTASLAPARLAQLKARVVECEAELAKAKPGFNVALVVEELRGCEDTRPLVRDGFITGG